MTREDFEARFYRRLLGLAGEAWAMRKESPSEFGIVMDRHLREIRVLMREMYDALIPPPKAPPNGPPAVKQQPTGVKP